MKKKWKIWLAILGVLVIGVSVYVGIQKSRAGIVTVQTGRAVRQDLTSVVTASGEIKPRNYISIGANVIGRLTEILVKEGDHVTKGQLLLRTEDVQQSANVDAQQAAVKTAQADSSASEAAVQSAAAALKTAQADLAQADNAHRQAGEFDHPLTCVALLELGRIKLRQGDYKSAANFFEEATYAAATYSNYGVLEEAFRYAALGNLFIFACAIAVGRRSLPAG